jgi:putative ABC transport system permease protein
MLRDLRLSLGMVRKNPSFAGSAILVMALGIGASTAVFSVLRGVLLEPLPYRDPGRIVLFRADLPDRAQTPALTSVEFAALHGRTDLFESVAAAVVADANLVTPEATVPLNAAAVSANFLETLGVVPLLGRSVGPVPKGAGRPVAIVTKPGSVTFAAIRTLSEPRST